MKPVDELEQLIAAVMAAAPYHRLMPELVRQVAAQEMSKGRRFKETVKAVRSKLHQVSGAYQMEAMALERWRAGLDALPRDPQDPALRSLCRQVMAQHASTRERLPILDEFYSRLLGDLGPIHSLLDIACGLNPFALPWMPLAGDAPYYGCDVFGDLVELGDTFRAHLRRPGEVRLCNLAQEMPPQRVQVALALKTLPCLEQLDKTLSLRLLNGLQADYLLVSFPARSLGGRARGMPQNYAARFAELVAGQPWQIERFDFASELVFLIKKRRR